MPRLSRSRRLPAVLAGAGAIALVAATAPAAGAAGTAPDQPTFSHEVVTDMQRSGFEPGIQVDSADRLYTSVPYGFSDTQSFLWSSEDHGNSYQLIPASVGTGKTQTCVGGGDSELALDGRDNLFFSDLQGLTNLSNSVTTDQGRSFTASCTSAPNTPVDRMWYAVHGNLGDPDFAIYEEYDAVASGLDPNNPTTNQLVETVSHDGVNFAPVVNSNLTDSGCLGGGAANCVTDDEGIPGNQVLAPNGDLLIAHTDASGNGVSVSRGVLSTTGTGTASVTQATWRTTKVNGAICPDGGAGQPCGAALFATIAEDTAGHFYVVFASAPHDANGTQSGPYTVYLVTSQDGNTWSAPVAVSNSGSNAFPWITAGDAGRIDVTYYHATEESEGGKFTFDDLKNGSFTVELAQSLDALSGTPTFTHSTVSEHPIKYGPICTSGLNCTVTGGDRSLGDYLQVGHDARGAAVVAFVDDTSNAFSTGAGPTGQVANTGPSAISRQIGGPSLFTSVGTVGGPGDGPGTPNDAVTDPTGDAFYSANGSKTPAGDNLDLTGGSIRQDGSNLVLTMNVKSLASLLPTPAAGGTTGEWITRFTTYNAGATPGNGHIFYVGMESVAGGTPTFYDGDTKRTRLFMTYQQDHALTTGAYDPRTGLITITAPISDFPGLENGGTLYSATPFTATTTGSLKGDPEGLFNLTDATTPFNTDVVATAAPSTAVPEVPVAVLAPLAAAGLLGAVVARRRRRA